MTRSCTCCAVPSAGFALTVKLLILENTGLSPPPVQGGLPALLPLGMFSTAPSKLRLIDVRLVVSQHDFAAYLTFFSQRLDATLLTAEGGSITMHTVRRAGVRGCKASAFVASGVAVHVTRCASGAGIIALGVTANMTGLMSLYRAVCFGGACCKILATAAHQVALSCRAGLQLCNQRRWQSSR
jgi:hypothetical protein